MGVSLQGWRYPCKNGGILARMEVSLQESRYPCKNGGTLARIEVSLLNLKKPVGRTRSTSENSTKKGAFSVGVGLARIEGILARLEVSLQEYTP